MVLTIGPEGVTKSEIFTVLGMLFVLALVSIYFLLIAPEMAAVILSSQSGSALPGIIGGLMASGAGFVGYHSARLTGKAAWDTTKMTAGGLWKGAQKVFQGRGDSATSVQEAFAENYVSPETHQTE